MTAEPNEVRRSRGDRQRDAIVGAVRELLQERSFADLSVSTISERAGVARSGFYFYFDSKYAVLAVILADASEELDKLTHDFAPREPDETLSDFAKRMVGSAAAVYATNDPVMHACAVARNTDAQIREMMDDFADGIIDKIVGLVEQDADARPISDDLPALVRTLAASTTMTLTHDSAFIGRGQDPARAVEIVERLWLYGLWGGSGLRERLTVSNVAGMAQGSGFTGKRCFLTGAASGIGRATALKLAAEGAELYLTDRDAEGLEETVADARALGAEVPEYRVSTSPTMTRSPPSPSTSTPTIQPMDVVMNIAGVSAWGTVDQLTHQHWKSMVDINLMGPIHVIETFVPPMLAARKGGHLVNVSSAAGLVALPWHAAYSASKYGLRGLSEVLRFDLARHRIGVSVVVPGAVKTPLVQTVQIAGVDREDPNVKRWTDRFSGHAVSPEHVADRILRGVRRNRFLIYTSPDIRALYTFKRLAWWPYTVAMRQANVLFTRALRPPARR